MSDEIYVPEVERIAVDLIRENTWNPNEMTETEFDMLVNEIRTVGFIQPVQIVPVEDGTYVMLGGAHRLQAAKVLGMETIPAVVLSEERWQERDLQKFATVRLNHLHGRNNTEKMVSLYREMLPKYGEKSLQRMFAYTEEDAWKKLVRQVKKQIKGSGLPKEAQEKFAKASKDANSIDDLSMILQRIMNEHGDTLKHSFLVFSFGGKEHLYIAMSPKTKKALDEVVKFCKEWGRDINQVIGDTTLAWLAEVRDAEELELKAGGEG